MVLLRSDSILLAIGVSCALVGVVGLAGWQLGHGGLLQPFTRFIPLQSAAALAFLSSGIGFGACALGWRRAVVACGLIPLLLGAVVLGHHGLSWSMTPLSLSSLVAIGFALVGAALAFVAAPPFSMRTRILAVLGAILAAVAVFGMLVQPGSVADGDAFRRLLAMSVQAAVGFLLVGAGLVLYVWRTDRAALHSPHALPWLVGIGGVTIVVALWQALVLHEQAQVRHAVSTEMSRVKHAVLAGLEARARALGRMADSWERAGRPSRRAWEFDAGLNVRDFPGFEAIQWIDPMARVRWVVPAGTASPRMPGAASKAAFVSVRDAGRRAEKLAGGRFSISVPVNHRGRADGEIVGLFHGPSLFAGLIVPGSGYAAAIRDGEEWLYRTAALAVAPHAEESLRFDGVDWHLRVAPTPALTDRLYTPLAMAFLVAGMAFSFLLAGGIYLAQASRLRARLVAAMNADLQQQVRERVRTQGVLQERTGYVQLLQRVAVAANEAASIEWAAQRAIDEVCALTGWPVGHLYLVSYASRLVSTGVWHPAQDARYAAFRAASDAIDGISGESLIGPVLASAHPAWTLDLARAADFKRAREAAAAGLRAAFAFPLLVRDEPAGILEFFAGDAPTPDPLLLEVMEQVGTQLGRVVERVRAEAALRASETKFRSVTESALDAIVAADGRGAVLSWNRGAQQIFGYVPEEILGQPLNRLVPERYRAQHEAGMERAVACGRSPLMGGVRELYGVRKDGSEFPMEISIAVWRADGEAFSSAIIRDITQRRAADDALRERERQLATAQAIAHVGSWEWDLATGAVIWSDELYRIYGYEPGAVSVSYQVYLEHVHPDDREVSRANAARALESGQGYRSEYRIVRPDGAVRVLHTQSECVKDGAGRASGMIGVCQDITERKQAEDEIRRLNADLEHRVKARTAQLQEINRELEIEIDERERAEQALHVRARQQAAVARIGEQALSGIGLDALMNEVVACLAETLQIEYSKILELEPDGASLLLRAGVGWPAGLMGQARVPADRDSQAGFTLLTDGPVVVEDLRKERRFSGPALLREHGVVSGLSVIIAGRERPYGVLGVHTRAYRTFSEDDVHFVEACANVLANAIERRRAEDERAQLLERERTARIQAETAERRASFLSRVSAVLGSSLDYEATLAAVARLLVPELADWCVVDLQTEEGTLQRVKAAHSDPEKEEYVQAVSERYPTDHNAKIGVAHVLRTGEPELVPEIPPGLLEENARDAEHLRPIRALGLCSYLCVPMKARGRAVGAISFVSAESGRCYGPDDLALAQEIAQRCGLAVENAMLYRSAEQEIARRMEAEESLAAEKERLAVTLHSIGDGVITADTSGRVVLLNKVAEQLTGWQQAEAMGRPVEQVFNVINEDTRAPCESPVRKVLESGATVALATHIALIDRDGHERVIADSGAPIRDRTGRILGVVLVFRDVTEQQKLEDELARARNLESIGLLAGGIAHDFNNILTAILGNVALAKLYSAGNEQASEVLGEAEKAFWRARDLTQQLLTFAKGGAPIKKMASIAELVRDTATFALRGSNVRYEFAFPPKLWSARVDVGQISQVVNNIVLNAKQAMPEGGLVRISLRNETLAQPRSLRLPAGRYVVLTIEDSGPGIPEVFLSHIFEPYFTTKQQGSGLGLATSYSIVKKHDGDIEVDSRVGEGTRFTAYLPAQPRTGRTPRAVPEPALAGEGRVLVMDDEVPVRDVAGKLLQRLGYEVAYAADGDEVLRLYREAMAAGRRFDAVIMDLTVPGAMGGKECMQRLLEIDPNVRAIVSSGYSNDPVMAEYERYGFRGVVAKPYQLEELSQTLHQVIRGGRR